MVVAVNDRDPPRRLSQCFGGIQPSETSTDDDHVRRHFALCLTRNHQPPTINRMKPATFATEHAVETVCPLDCPDACSLEVVVQDGRIASIDGTHVNPSTDGYICAKVRRFPERVYGPDRLVYPAIRKGPKGLGSFQRVSWDEA